MHPIIGELIARDRTATLIREADIERLVTEARSEGATRPGPFRRQVREVLRLGSRSPVAR
jgi:hypothetical protein